ncbi:MAG: hypothetical protein FIB01_14210, partial [Gemmatimonadetes bacterium]|nr:hypothetical protein [Gemmatimonadota bacterium]
MQCTQAAQWTSRSRRRPVGRLNCRLGHLLKGTGNGYEESSKARREEGREETRGQEAGQEGRQAARQEGRKEGSEAA